MKNNNEMISKLYTMLADELDRQQPYLSPRTRCEWDRRRRQGPVYKINRYYAAVFENHILERTCSVVFTIELTEQYCKLRFYAPLRQKEYDRLAASGYVPDLRSKVYLNVGLGQSGGTPYAYSEVRISQYAGVIDLFEALHTLGKELDTYITQ